MENVILQYTPKLHFFVILLVVFFFDRCSGTISYCGRALQELCMIILFGLKKMSLDEVLLVVFSVERAVMIARKQWPSNRWLVPRSKTWINCGLKSTSCRTWIIPTSSDFWKPMRTDVAFTLQLSCTWCSGLENTLAAPEGRSQCF